MKSKKMLKHLNKVLSAILLAAPFFFATSLMAGEITTGSLWWTEKDDGWFFYNEHVETPLTEEEEAPPPKQTASSVLFTERMERRGKELMSRAMEDPTEDNVRAYMEYNKSMLVLADNFTKVWQKAIMKYPHLLFSEGLTHASRDIENTISSLKERAGLYFIHSSSCPACSKQAAELKKFEAKYGMEVLAITVDKKTLPEYPDAVADNGIVSALGVESVPSIFIVIPSEKKIDLVAQGFIDNFELERRLFNYERPIEKEGIETFLRTADHSFGTDNSDR